MKNFKDKELLILFKQLLLLLDGETDFFTVLSILNIENIYFKKILSRIKRGEVFSKTIEGEFPFHVVAIIKAGESSGDIRNSFKEVVKCLEGRMILKKKLISSLSYPLFLFCFSFIIIFLLLLIVVPEFEIFYQDISNDLPFLTRLFFSLSNNIYLMLVPVVLLLLLFNKEVLKRVLSFNYLKLKLRIFYELLFFKIFHH